jgi:uncharacterized protein (DUF849 family)
MSKTIFSAAITGGIHTPTMSDYLPITPDQIAENAIQAYEAGAAVAHIHVRNPETGRPSSDLDLFKKVFTKVKSKCDIILAPTTGGGFGMTPEERVGVVSTFKPELASFNTGSMNFALFQVLDKMREFKFPWEKEYLGSTEDFIFANTFKTMKIFCKIFDESRTKPELEIFDAGMISNTAFLIQQGLLKTPVYLQFVLGILGGISATLENLFYLRDAARREIGEKNFLWSVCAAARSQMPLCTSALLMGGNARVGMEDALWVSRGVPARNNADLVEKIIRIAREFDVEPATPAEARKILGLKGADHVNF